MVSFLTYLQVKEGDGKDDLLGLPVEPTGLEGAAFQSRVPNDKMTQVHCTFNLTAAFLEICDLIKI